MQVENLVGMAIFARVAATGSFNAAARDLGWSASAVSKQVSRLEDQLGVRLLQRSTRSLALTEVGEQVYSHCQRVLMVAEDVAAVVEQARGEPQGTLRLLLPPALGQLRLAPLLGEFLARHPQLHVELRLSGADEDLIEHHHDLALRLGPLPDSRLHARALGECHYQLCATPGYLLHHSLPTTVEQLITHRCVISPGPAWDFQDGDGKTHRHQPHGAVVADSALLVRELLLVGLGVGLLPAYVVSEDLVAGRLQRLLPDHSMPMVTVYGVYPSARHLSPKVRLFLDYLATTLQLD